MKHITVLIADDHAIVVEGLRRVLERDFDVVGGLGDGRALVAAAERLRPDVIVADISMPLLNGLDAARQIRKSNPDAKIIFLSMHPDLIYVREAMSAGGSAYVLKSSAGIEIVTAIREVLRGRTYLSPSLDKAALQAHSRRDQASHYRPENLTPRQREVVQLIAEGRSTKEIASILNVSTRTVEFHRYRVMSLLGIHTIAELVQYAIKHHLVSP